MIPNPPTMTIPLRTDDQGAIRVGQSRVLLELVIHAYYLGETPKGLSKAIRASPPPTCTR